MRGAKIHALTQLVDYTMDTSNTASALGQNAMSNKQARVISARVICGGAIVLALLFAMLFFVFQYFVNKNHEALRQETMVEWKAWSAWQSKNCRWVGDVAGIREQEGRFRRIRDFVQYSCKDGRTYYVLGESIENAQNCATNNPQCTDLPITPKMWRDVSQSDKSTMPMVR